MTFFLSLSLLFLCFCDVSLTKIINHGFTVELIHPNSQRSPFYNSTETQFQRVSNVVHHSINRIHYLNRVYFASSNNTPESTITPYVGQCYVMNYSIGTPPFQLYGMIDTGSDLIWSQCKPCKPCFNQTSQIFDPSKSSTYKIISCTSPTCKNVQPTKCSSDNKKRCEYKYVYGDMSYTQGDLSVETLTLTSNDDSPISFPRIVIGCGHKNWLSVDGKISGIIGLGRGPMSLVSQLGSSIDRKFSYCLVPFFLNANTSSKLIFGHRALVSGTGTVSTPLVRGIINSFYYTNLEAFSVGDIVIKLELSTFGPNKRGNTVIDSGSTLTLLPYAIYSRLESAMAAMIKLKRTKDPTHQMSLCYKTRSKMLEVPTITAHFSGADVHLKAVNTFIQIDHEVVCFAFVADTKFNPGFVVFGNIAQQNFLVGFDLQKNIVSFKPTDCTKH